ncbi:hypothetical protein [Geomonas ferrireducens]|uniref:hypothetical protein n=1 Tax=Geomonas ferrireducens TaxID=2570227 RepID=UPI0010A83E27|nr:hypothetical protein [Geomonas ferrireducens]
MRDINKLNITPIDIRYIRHALRLSQKQMGLSLTEYLYKTGEKFIPGSRINEWEMQVRSIPDHIFIAYARFVVDTWVKTRIGKSKDIQRIVDPKFAGLLSPAFEEAIILEAELIDNSSSESDKFQLGAIKVRKTVQKYLEKLLFLDLNQVL